LQQQVRALRTHVEALAALGRRLERQVNTLAQDYAGLAEVLRER
jgi:hypothetical protein